MSKVKTRFAPSPTGRMHVGNLRTCLLYTSCIEPWCGLPNSINTGRFVKWVDPGKTEEYGMRFSFGRL